MKIFAENIPKLEDMATDKTGKCILSLYPSDAALLDRAYGLDSLLRISPFSGQIQFVYRNQDAPPSLDYREIVELEEESGIYSVHLGCTSSKDEDVKYENAYFRTDSFLWPKAYTMLIWVKWDKSISLLTTFDSAGSVPMVVSRSRLAVDRGHKWEYTDYELQGLGDKWHFIAVSAGNMSSSFYCGDLGTKPKLEGTVNNDICGERTYKIGNPLQGPGKVALLKVFDSKLDVERIEDEYFWSRYEISLQWMDEEVDAIKSTLIRYIGVQGIVDCGIEFSCFSKYRTKL